MQLLNKIWVTSLLLLWAVSVKAQDQGNVVVHSDPRLSLLVKKPHNMEPIASNVPLHRSTPRTTARKDISVSAPVTGTANTTSSRNTVKISSDDASTTGHAGGWSPPVHRRARAIYSGKGFRVQIYNGSDRSKAIEVKTHFMRLFPGLRTYLTYISPCFRVKVGDYKTRNEALGMLKEANSMYSPCMIVPDIITISTF
jgi:hypothetical protein